MGHNIMVIHFGDLSLITGMGLQKGSGAGLVVSLQNMFAIVLKRETQVLAMLMGVSSRGRNCDFPIL